MKTINQAISIAVTMLLSFDVSAAETKVSGHGAEQVIKVKKKPQRYFEAAADSTWVLSLKGPAKVAVGIRAAVGKGATGEIVVVADLDDQEVSSTSIALRAEKGASVAGLEKDKVLSQEIVIVYAVAAGDHALRLSIQGGDRAFLRITPKASAKATKASPFETKHTPPVVADVAPPPAPRAPEPPPAPTAPIHSVSAAEPSAPSLAPIGDAAPSASGPEVIMAASPQDVAQPTPASSASIEAKESQQALERRQLFPLTAKVAVGMMLPQVVTKLSTGMHFNLGVGYLLPVLDQRIEVWIDGSYIQATRRGSASDARLLASDMFDYTIVEREILIGFGGLYRFFSPRERGFNYFGRLGGRVDMQRSDVHGDAASAGFGSNSETRSVLGLLVGGGVEYGIGPGAIAAELDFAIADLSHRTSGDTSTGGLGLNVGYHFTF